MKSLLFIMYLGRKLSHPDLHQNPSRVDHILDLFPMLDTLHLWSKIHLDQDLLRWIFSSRIHWNILECLRNKGQKLLNLWNSWFYWSFDLGPWYRSWQRYALISISERLNLHFVGSAEPMPNRCRTLTNSFAIKLLIFQCNFFHYFHTCLKIKQNS